MADEELKCAIFNTVMGWVGILGSTVGLLGITLPHRSRQEARQQLGERIELASRSLEPFADLIKRLKTYFSGHEAIFPDELDLSGATDFRREVWEATRRIPYGETRSYTWVANQIKKPRAQRAVGQALARNPLPLIIPCHRVIASDGKLRGFSGGVEMKRQLLRMEANS